MPLPLIILALSAFCIGTTEFIVLGLLSDIARDLSISLSQAGFVVTCYALSVAVGSPIMALATNRFSRKLSLIGLMVIFIAGNMLCALAQSYTFLLLARMITALCHGAFFGIGAVEAASLAPENRKASAVASMFAGLTLSNIIGVPLGSMLGHATHWQVPFIIVAFLGMISLVFLAYTLPTIQKREFCAVSLSAEMRALKDKNIWMALATTVMSSTALFSLFTYVVPILEDITHMANRHTSWILLLIGVGLTLGNILGGKLADTALKSSLIGLYIIITAIHIIFFWTSGTSLGAALTLLLWGIASFCAVPMLQTNVVNVGNKAPNLISTLNIGAFNMGNAAGAWIASLTIYFGMPLAYIPFLAAFLSSLAFLMALRAKDNKILHRIAAN